MNPEDIGDNAIDRHRTRELQKKGQTGTDNSEALEKYRKGMTDAKE